MEGLPQLVFAFEWIVIAWRSGFSGMPFQMEANPMRRHNIIIGPTLRVHHKNRNNEVINPYQKPPYLAFNLCKTFAAPLDTILVIGFGAGGDIEGASCAGMNVVGIERDKKQYDGTLAVWRSHQQKLSGASDFPTVFPSMTEGRFGSFPVDFDIPIEFIDKVKDYVQHLREGGDKEAEPDVGCCSCDFVLGKRGQDVLCCTKCHAPLCDSCADGIKRAAGRDPYPSGRFCKADCIPL